MKVIKKASTIVIAYMILTQILLGTAFCTSASAATVSQPILSSSTDRTITIQATEYVWVVKKVNGIVYKRLFNETTGQWVGDWTRA